MNKVTSESQEISSIEEMIEYAWQKAIKYRFDPVAGRIHEEYLEMVKGLKKQLETKRDQECETRFILGK